MVNERGSHEAIVPGKEKEYNTPRNVWLRPYRLVGLLAVPIEVLLRRNFGQRWFTFLNFLGGVFVLVVVAAIEWLVALFLDSKFYGWLQVHLLDEWHVQVFHARILMMPWFAGAYLLLSFYHFSRIWWRSRIDTRLHSFDDGTSLLEPVAYYIMRLINLLADPFIRFFRLFLPRSVRREQKIPTLLNNITRFTGMVIEPLFLVGVSLAFHGVTRVWVWVSAVAIMIFAYRKSIVRKNKFLDFNDAVVESRYMKTYHSAQGDAPSDKAQVTWEKEVKQKKATDTKTQPDYPDLDEIIEKMNNDREHLAN